MPAPVQPRFAVLVTGDSEAVLRLFLARYVKLGLGMRRNQWRARYRGAYPLTVLSRPLRAGDDPEAIYGPHAASSGLVLAAFPSSRKDSGRDAARAWLAAKGYEPRVELALSPAQTESESIDQGIVVVNYVNAQCPWPSEGIGDLDAYLAKNGGPFWL